MQKKYFYNLITSLLIIALIVPLPYLTSVQKAEAQTTQGAYQTNGGGVGGYLSTISVVLPSLPLCKGELTGVIQKLFRKSGVGDTYEQYRDTFEGNYENGGIPLGREEWEAQLAESLAETEAIEVLDKENRRLAVENARKTTGIQDDIAALKANDTCFKSIGKMVVKLALQKITQSTVEWIQGGVRDGSPAFIENPKSFFRDVAREEILKFGLEINDETLYPFGKAFLISQAEAFNRHFDENARYSLNELINQTTPEYTAHTFNQDFSKGGWNAWTALTSVPANNPLGFQLMASNELSKRLEDVYKSPANEIRDALAQADGYLGDQRCVDPQGMTKEESDALLEAGDKEHICKRWEYVTPGKMVADWATKLAQYPDNNLLAADDLNTAIAAILDALLAKYTPDLQSKGFTDFSSEGSDGSYILNADGILTGADSQIERDFNRFQLGGQWLQDHPNFNIRTDVTQALIDEQRIYRTKLEEQNAVLKDLTKTIFQLDYCIPGPHPGWEQDSREVLSAVESSIVSKTKDDFANMGKQDIIKTAAGIVKLGAVAAGAIIGASIGTAALPIVGTIIGAAIGAAVGLIINFIEKKWIDNLNDDEKLTLYYGTIVNSFTGIPVDIEGEGSSRLRQKQEVTNGLDTMLYRYVDLIHKYFTPEYLPPVAKDAAKEFRKAVAYNQTINDNNDKIVLLNGIIKRLTAIKNGIQELNDQYPGAATNTATPDVQIAYEAALDESSFKSEFARLTSNMVTGDDIAVIDNLAKQAKDEITYVYDDLLTGPYGCEQDLRTNYRLTPGNPTRTWILRGTTRAEYPVDLWYDYNEFQPNDVLPVPQELFDKGYTIKTVGNQMPPPDTTIPVESNGVLTTDSMKYGPGFLSGVWYNQNSSSSGFSDPEYGDGDCGQLFAEIITNAELAGMMLDCMKVTDIWRAVNGTKATPTVGRKGYVDIPPASCGSNSNDFCENEQKNTSFEQTIGVY